MRATQQSRRSRIPPDSGKKGGGPWVADQLALLLPSRVGARTVWTTASRRTGRRRPANSYLPGQWADLRMGAALVTESELPPALQPTRQDQVIYMSHVTAACPLSNLAHLDAEL